MLSPDLNQESKEHLPQIKDQQKHRHNKHLAASFKKPIC